MLHYFTVVGLCLAAILLIYFLARDAITEARWLAGMLGVYLLEYALSTVLWRTPHSITLHEPGKLIFKCLVSKKTFATEDLKSIKAGFLNTYFLYFTFKKGKVTVLNSVDGLPQLILLIKGDNPNVQIEGC